MYEIIDNYFEGRLSAAEQAAFEARLEQDSALADEVAFYLSTKAALKEVNLQKRHAEWTQQRSPQSLHWQWVSGVAAAILLLIAVWYTMQPSTLPLQAQADAYIKQNLMVLPGTLGTSGDSLQKAIGYYNNQKYKEALPIFEKLAHTNYQANTYEGLTQLQLKHYDIAIDIFERMANNTELLENRGKFYTALTCLKKGDNATAQRLLEEIISQNLPGKAEAEKWLMTTE